MSGYDPPEVKLVGNLHDLLQHVCPPKGADGWVFVVSRDGWKISVTPSDGKGAPYEMEVTTPTGSPRFYSSFCRSVEEACSKGADVLESYKVEFNRFDVERLGRAMDKEVERS